MANRYTRRRDGVTVDDSEACPNGVVLDGYSINFDIMLMDKAAGREAAFSLRDAAGVPLKLVDRDSGAPFALNAELIAAIEAEAAKCGMSVGLYVKNVLRLSEAQARLSGRDPDHPAAEA